MLAIGLRFLTGRYYAAHYTERSLPEWPPHPDRLFSALVASCYQSCAGQGRETLQWLELQEPPSLALSIIPAALRRGRTIDAMVRTNDIRTGARRIKVLPEIRTPQPRSFPSITIEEPVYFIWPNAYPDAQQIADLQEILDHVAYLGSSKSPVALWVETTPPPPNLMPEVQTDFRLQPLILRIPSPGRLRELDDLFANSLRPQPGRKQAYQWNRHSSQPPLPAVPLASSFGEIVIFARTGGPVFTSENTLTVTHALRRALLALAETSSGQSEESRVPELLHGHGPKQEPHCAFIGLPFVGSAYADGHLLGIAIVLPRHCSEQDRISIFRTLAVLEQVQTAAGQIQLSRLGAMDDDEIPQGLRAKRWSGPATTWTTVTPVLFDHYPRVSRGGILGAAQTLARHALLPEPIAAQAHQFSPIAGVARAADFRVQRNEETNPRYVSHLTITFAEAVEGPLLLGAGRFFGLGLFLPHEQRRKEGV